MHNQWAEASGLRNEPDAFMTTSPRAALQWPQDRIGKEGMAAALEATVDV